MKITNYTKRKLKPGVTLIELTVVIVVILSLISVLFIGANAYRNGASRSACIVKLRTVHQSIRSHQNLNNGVAGMPLEAGAADFTAAIVGAGSFLSVAPVCPRDNVAYTGMDGSSYPAVDTVAVTCTNFGNATDDHIFTP